MSLAFKCDRCGTFFERKTGEEHFIVARENMNTIRDIDLCSSCQSAFELFLQKKSFTPDEVFSIVCVHGQHDRQFVVGETIKYTASEIQSILKERNGDG